MATNNLYVFVDETARQAAINAGKCTDANSYISIQAAAVAAVSGDTINIAAGTYGENVVINTTTMSGSKALNFVGETDAAGTNLVTLTNTWNIAESATQYKAALSLTNLDFYANTANTATAKKTALSIVTIDGITVSKCNFSTPAKDDTYLLDVPSSPGGTKSLVIEDCTFTNGRFNLYRSNGNSSMFKNCTISEIIINIQGGDTYTFTDCAISYTLTEANAGDSLYLIRTNGMALNITGTSFKLDNSAGISANGAAWAVLWTRSSNAGTVTLDDCPITIVGDNSDIMVVNNLNTSTSATVLKNIDFGTRDMAEIMRTSSGRSFTLVGYDDASGAHTTDTVHFVSTKAEFEAITDTTNPFVFILKNIGDADPATSDGLAGATVPVSMTIVGKSANVVVDANGKPVIDDGADNWHKVQYDAGAVIMNSLNGQSGLDIVLTSGVIDAFTGDQGKIRAHGANVTLGEAGAANSELYIAGNVFAEGGTLTVNSGFVLASILGGSEMTETIGNSNVVISGGWINQSVQGGGNTYSVTEVSNITITGGKVGFFADRYGDPEGVFGGSRRASVGTANVEVSGGVVEHGVYGGGYARSDAGATVTTATVTITGSAEVNDVFGGGLAYSKSGSTGTASTVGTATVNIEGGTISGDVYAGGSLDLRNSATGMTSVVTGNATVNISGGTIAGGVYGDGKDGATVTGIKALNISGGSINGEIAGFNAVTVDVVTVLGAISMTDGDDTFTVKDNFRLSVDSLDFGAGVDTLSLDNGYLMVSDLAGVTRIAGTGTLYLQGITVTAAEWLTAMGITDRSANVYILTDSQEIDPDPNGEVEFTRNDQVVNGDAAGVVVVGPTVRDARNRVNGNVSSDRSGHTGIANGGTGSLAIGGDVTGRDILLQTGGNPDGASEVSIEGTVVGGTVDLDNGSNGTINGGTNTDGSERGLSILAANLSINNHGHLNIDALASGTVGVTNTSHDTLIGTIDAENVVDLSNADAFNSGAVRNLMVNASNDIDLTNVAGGTVEASFFKAGNSLTFVNEGTVADTSFEAKNSLTFTGSTDTEGVSFIAANVSLLGDFAASGTYLDVSELFIDQAAVSWSGGSVKGIEFGSDAGSLVISGTADAGFESLKGGGTVGFTKDATVTADLSAFSGTMLVKSGKTLTIDTNQGGGFRLMADDDSLLVFNQSISARVINGGTLKLTSGNTVTADNYSSSNLLFNLGADYTTLSAALLAGGAAKFDEETTISVSAKSSQITTAGTYTLGSFNAWNYSELEDGAISLFVDGKAAGSYTLGESAKIKAGGLNYTVKFDIVQEDGKSLFQFSTERANAFEETFSGTISTDTPAVAFAASLTAGAYSFSGDFGDLKAKVTIYDADGKKVTSGSVKKGELKLKDRLIAAGDYTILVQSSDKAKTVGDFSLTVKGYLYDRGVTADDWTEMKTLGAAGLPAEYDLGSVTTPGDLLTDWIGFGDAVDYRKLTLDTAAELDFTLEADGKAKFAIYTLEEKKNGYKLKKIGGTLSTGDKTPAKSGTRLLEAGEYYIGIESPTAKKGADIDYTVRVDDTSTFFTKGYNGDDIWQTANELGAIGTDGSFTDWVGCGDVIDFWKFSVDEDGLFSVGFTADDKAKLTIYELTVDKKGNEKLKKGKTLSVSDGSKSFEGLLEAGTYYFGIESTNAKKGGDADYEVSYQFNRDLGKSMLA